MSFILDLWKNKKDNIIRNYIFILSILSLPFIIEIISIVFNEKLYLIDKFNKSRHVLNLIFLSNFISLILSLVLFLFPKSLLKIVFWITILFLSTVYFIDINSYFLFNSHLNPSFIYTIFSSDIHEKLGFTTNYFTFKSFIILVSLSLFFIFLLKALTKDTQRFQSKLYFFLFLLFTFTSLFQIIRNGKLFKQIPIISVATSYFEYKNEIYLFKQKNKNDLSKIKIVDKKYSDEETHIIVIGESTSKYHMGLYGYYRNTNPKLTKIKNELLVFKHATTNYVHTIESLKDFLLINKKQSKLNISIIDVLNKAGYQTFWISNQEIIGNKQSIITHIANSCNKNYFVNQYGDKKYDGVIIPKIDKILHEKIKKKVIFVHLLGTHLDYEDRYPSTFNHFQKPVSANIGRIGKAKINHYDNAIRYNDMIIASIINKVKKLSVPSSMIYFSDHGDEVFDFRDFHGHASTMKSIFMTQTPFVFYANKKFINKHSFAYEELKHKTQQNFSLNKGQYFIQKITSAYSNFYDSTFFTKGLHIENETNHINNRIGCHRVNGIKRFNEVKNHFKTLEMDVVFEDNELYVRHPPEKRRIKLDNLLQHIKNKKKYRLWLDLKNINQNNKDEIAQKLKSIRSNMKEIWVESPTLEVLKYLKEKNFKCVYYLPSLIDLNEEKCLELSKQLSKYPSFKVSQSFENYELMKKYFPKHKKLTWISFIEQSENDKFPVVDFILKNDSTIECCLVNYKTKHWI